MDIEQGIKQMGRFSEIVGKDLMEPLQYVPGGMGIAGIILLAVLLYEAVRWLQQGHSFSGKAEVRAFFGLEEAGRKGFIQRHILWYLCIVYVTVVLRLTFFSREPGSRKGIDLGLFETWGTSLQAHAYVIENILMFVPFGILFPAALRFFRRGYVCLTAALLCSVGLETMQLLTQRGHCQLDDVVTNTLGALAGWLIYRWWQGGAADQISFK